MVPALWTSAMTTATTVAAAAAAATWSSESGSPGAAWRPNAPVTFSGNWRF